MEDSIGITMNPILSKVEQRVVVQEKGVSFPQDFSNYDDMDSDDYEEGDTIDVHEIRQSMAAGLVGSKLEITSLVKRKKTIMKPIYDTLQFAQDHRCSFPSRNHLTTYSGHRKSVRAVDVYIPNETIDKVTRPESDEVIVITGCLGGKIILWNGDTGNQLSQLNFGDDTAIHCLKVINSNPRIIGTFATILLAGGENNKIVVWDLFRGAVLRCLENVHTWFVSCLGVTTLNWCMFMAQEQDKLRQADVDISSTMKSSFTLASMYSSLQERCLVLSGSYDRLVQVWDLLTGVQLYSLGQTKGFHGSVCMQIFSSSTTFFHSPWVTQQGVPAAVDTMDNSINTSYVMLGTFDNRIVVYNLNKRQKLATFENLHPEIVLSLDVYIKRVQTAEFGEAGRECAIALTGSRDGSAIVWCATTGRMLLKLATRDYHGGNPIHSVSLVPTAEDNTIISPDVVSAPIDSIPQPAGEAAVCRQSDRATVGADEENIGAFLSNADITVKAALRRVTADVKSLRLAVRGNTVDKVVYFLQQLKSQMMQSAETAAIEDVDADVIKAEKENRDFAEALSCLPNLLAITACKGGLVIIWDLTRNYVIRCIDTGVYIAATQRRTTAYSVLALRAYYSPHKSILMGTKLKFTGSYRDDFRLLVAVEDGTVVKYDLSSPLKKEFAKVHKNWVNCIALFTPPPCMQHRVDRAHQLDGVLDFSKQYVVSSSNNIAIWEVPSCEHVKTIDTGTEDLSAAMVVYCPFSAEKYTTAVRTSFKDATTPAVAATSLLSELEQSMNDIVMKQGKTLPPSPLVVLSTFEGGLHSWCMASGRRLVSYATHTAACSLLIWNDLINDRDVLIAGTKDGSIVKFDLLTGEPLMEVPCDIPVVEPSSNSFRHDGNIVSLELYYADRTVYPSNCCRDREQYPLLISASASDRVVCVWDLIHLRPLKIFRGIHTDQIRTLTLHIPVPDTVYGSSRQLAAQSPCSEPLIITGGMDGLILVRRLGLVGDGTNIFFRNSDDPSGNISKGDIGFIETGDDDLSDNSVVHKIYSGQTGVISSVKIFDAAAHEGHQLILKHSGHPIVHLLSGSFDGSVGIICLHSGVVVKLLDSVHFGKLHCLSLYIPMKSHTGPYVLSGGQDKVVILRDIFYPSDQSVISPAAFEEAFGLDLKDASNKCWPRVNNLVKILGPSLLLENKLAFFSAIENHRTDYLLQFEDSFKSALPHMLTLETRECVLTRIVAMRDVSALRIVLRMWSELLNRDMDSNIDQLYLHPSRAFNANLLGDAVATWMPAYYVEFIASLHPVRSAPMLAGKVKEARLDAKYRHFAVTCYKCDLFNLWEHIVEETEINSRPVISMSIPMSGIAGLRALQSFVSASDALGHADIFDTEVGVNVMRYMWHAFGRDAYYRKGAVFVVFWFFYSLTIYEFEHFYGLLMAIPMVFSIQKLYWIRLFIVRKAAIRGGSAIGALTEYFENYWNLTEMGLHIALLWGMCMRISDIVRGGYLITHGYDVQETVLSISSLFMVTRVLYYLRPVPGAGPLVMMLLRILVDIRVFILILVALLFSFSQTFWLLSPSEAPAGLLFFSNSFLAMLGNFDIAELGAGSYAPSASIIINILFLGFIVVVMLNFLIALMGDSFSRSAEKAKSQWRLTQARILLDLAEEYELPTIPPCFELLVYEADVDKLIVSSVSTTQEEQLSMRAEVASLSERMHRMEQVMTQMNQNLENVITKWQ